MTRMRSAAGIAAGITISSALVLALTGCTAARPKLSDSIPHDAPSGGQTQAEAFASIDAIEGLTVTGGGTSKHVSGNGSTGADVAITVDPGYTVVDGGALVTFITETMWSIREGYQPNTGIQISVSAPRDSTFNVAEAAIEGGWDRDRQVRPVTTGFSETTVALKDVDGAPSRNGAENLKRLGPWPGAVPEAPAGAVAKTG